MNHHKQDISGDCMKVVIHWVEDLAIDVPHLLAKKMHLSLCKVPSELKCANDRLQQKEKEHEE